MSEKNERLKKIVQLLGDKKFITAKQLADDLSVSEMTIRRDIATLEKDNIVSVFFGGISLTDNMNNVTSSPSGYVLDKEIREYSNEKKRIAYKAASLIEPNDVILLDTGSTTGYVVDYISNEMSNIIYSYSLSILNGIYDKRYVKVVGCGGYFHKETMMFESEEGEQLLKKTQINKAFMAARGVSEIGITTAENYEIGMKKAALEVSKQKILLVDSSKFGKAWYAKYAELKDIDIIITDDNIKEEHKKMIEEHNIKLYVV